MARATAIGGQVPTNGAVEEISTQQPYMATVLLKGTADMLFHRWNCEAVEEKGKAAKGSKAKKTDNIESYVYRDGEGCICLPGEYVRQAIIHAAKYRQDPRSPRKSAMDLYKAGVVALSVLSPLMDDGQKMKTWSYEHKCRVTIQRNGITRTRPAIKEGWEAYCQLMILLPEYIRPADLQDVLVNAGRLVGLADFRPTYGRFSLISFDIGFND
jgi:hypothetical protein